MILLCCLSMIADCLFCLLLICGFVNVLFLIVGVALGTLVVVLIGYLVCSYSACVVLFLDFMCCVLIVCEFSMV